MKAFGDASSGKTAPGKRADTFFLAGEFDDRVAASLGTAKGGPFGTLAGEGFFGALGDEVAFDFGGEAECEGKDFGGDIVAETVVIFDGPDADVLLHAEVEDFENHEE